MGKTYRGHRDAAGRLLVEVARSGERLGYPLKHIVRHSPTGFEAGYGGSGPADLAASLLADHLGYPVAARVYQAFKFNVVARLARDDEWTLMAAEVDVYLAGIMESAGLQCARCGDRGYFYRADLGPVEDQFCPCAEGQRQKAAACDR